jgi:high-affinity K+ transport system ATPase subunit B
VISAIIFNAIVIPALMANALGGIRYPRRRQRIATAKTS